MLALLTNNTTAVADGVVQFEVVTTNAGASQSVVAVSMGATTTVTVKMFTNPTATNPWVQIAAGITSSGTITLPGAGLYCVNVARSAGADRADVTVHGYVRSYPPSNVV